MLLLYCLVTVSIAIAFRLHSKIFLSDFISYVSLIQRYILICVSERVTWNRSFCKPCWQFQLTMALSNHFRFNREKKAQHKIKCKWMLQCAIFIRYHRFELKSIDLCLRVVCWEKESTYKLHRWWTSSPYFLCHRFWISSFYFIRSLIHSFSAHFYFFFYLAIAI